MIGWEYEDETEVFGGNGGGDDAAFGGDGAAGGLGGEL